MTLSLSNFVFVHAVELIDLLERRETFAGLKGHTYVLLGPRERHERALAASPHREKVILAAALPRNIEGVNNFLQFTGWYALASNPLIADGVDCVGLYEYDVEVTPEFDARVRGEFERDPDLDILGFLSHPKSVLLFDRTDPFCRQITRFLEWRLKIAASDFLLNRTPSYPRWTVTTNVVMKRRRFLEFMWSDCVGELMDFLDNDRMSGHALERCISLHYMLNGWRAAELRGQLVHVGADSHDTQGHKEIYDRGYGV